MRRKLLGRTDLVVTPWCLGTNVMGGRLDEAESINVLDAYVNTGGNFIDTANNYPAPAVPGRIDGGESEAIIGRWMKLRRNRNDVVLATKIGRPARPPVTEQGLSRRAIINGLESSLRRLGTDHLDLFYAHCDDPDTPLEDSLEAFELVRSQGKTRWIGASNYTEGRLALALGVSEAKRVVRYECLQTQFNLVDRSEFEPGLMRLCADKEVAVTTFYSLAKGFLTGKYSRSGPLPSTPRAPGVAANYLDDKGFGVLDKVLRVANRIGATPAQVSLAWLMRQPTVVSCLAAATSSVQVTELAASADVDLSSEDLCFLSGPAQH